MAVSRPILLVAVLAALWAIGLVPSVWARLFAQCAILGLLGVFILPAKLRRDFWWIPVAGSIFGGVVVGSMIADWLSPFQAVCVALPGIAVLGVLALRARSKNSSNWWH
jgi:hypothetical protein